MNLVKETQWINKINNQHIEGMVQYGESDYKPAIKRKKTKKQLQPFNLTTTPLQDITQTIDSNTPQISATNVLPDINQENTTPTWLKSVNTKIQESFVEGLASKNESIGQQLKPIFQTIDFIILWVIDKFCIEYPTLIITFVSQTLCEIGSDKDSKIPINPADKALIEDQFKLFLSIVISCWVVYNWFFLMFYDSKPTPVIIDKYIINNYNSILGYLFKYIIEPVSILNWVLTDLIPKYTKIVVSNAKILFILLLLIIIYIIRTFGASYMNAFSNNLKRKPALYSELMISIMIFSGIFSAFIAIETLRSGSIFGIGSELLGMSETNKYYYSFSELMNYTKTIPSLFLPQLISFVIRITFSIVCVWLAGILAFGYLLLYSFFAIPLYSKGYLYDTVLEINDNVNSYSTNDSYDETILQQFINFINKIFEILYTYLFEIIFIIFFVQSIINYSININNNILLSIIVILSIICLFIIVFFLITKKNNKTMDQDIINSMNPHKQTCNTETSQV